MARYAQTSFIGGMNMAVDDSRIGDDEYRIGYNVRNRFGELRPIRRPEELDTGIDSQKGSIDSITIHEGGTGYSAGNLVATDPTGSGSGFAGTYTVSGGVVNTVTITNGGENYSKETTISTQHAGNGDNSLSYTLDYNESPVQGLYALGDFLIIVQNGNARFRHRLSTTWTTLWDASTNATLRLDPNASDVFIQAVPGSTMDIPRRAKDNQDALGTEGAHSIELHYNTALWARTDAGVVFQDGSNQPNLLTFSSSEQGATATVRKCKTYTEWGATYREYVPIGKQMVYFNGKLFIVSADGQKIYQSVTGRPLDFVTAIDTTGAQIDAAESNGGAEVTAYSVSYEKISCIAPLNTDSLLVSTRTGTFAIKPDYEHTLFGEPTWTKQYMFGASVVNQFSFVDILGDFAFIDAEGLRSFNAVRQLRNEGRNSAFSLKVAKLFEDIVQVGGAAISFDNYTFFSVKTIYGYGVLVFDGTLQKFVSLDLYQTDTDETLGQITHFSKIDTDTTHEVYAVTAQGGFYRLFTGAKYNDSFVQTKAFNTGTLDVEQKPMQLRTLFNGIERWEYDAIRLTEGANVSPNGVNTNHSNPGTLETGSAFALDVEAVPFDLASGTEIFFTGGSPNTGGTFTLTEAANEGTTVITGTFTSTGTINKFYTKGFIRFTGEGTARVAVISNARKSETPSTISKTIAAPKAIAVNYTDTYPVMWNNENKMQNFLFNFQQGRQGLKVGYTIEWNTNATLSMITPETIDLTPKNPFMTQAYGSNS
jgi:hypothetical protein